MSCYFPLHAFKAKAKESDKIAITFRRPDSWRGESLKLPCGQCIGCRLEKSRQWAVRCMHEASLYDENSFVTLTFDDEHVPEGNWLCERCVSPHVVGGSVCVSVFQDFVKRLRKERGPGIRYYHCGEYGEQNSRPHYHALLFNLSFPDKKFFSERNGNRLYTSEELSRLWPFGFAVVGDVTFESAGYVARYVMKKVTGDRTEAHYQGRKPEYTTMSRRPGIGKGWYEKFKADVYPRDRVVVRGRDTRPPRFYDNLLGREDRSTLELLKIERERFGKFYVTDTLSNGKVIRESDSCDRRLGVKEVVKQAQVGLLRREL